MRPPHLREVVRNGYLQAVGNWGWQPSEFWSSTPREWMWMWEHKRPRDPSRDFAGSLTEADVKELLQAMRDAPQCLKT